MQTILGAGGVIGVELAKNLKSYGDPIRLVSRHPRQVNNDDLLHSCDLTQPEDVRQAVTGSKVVYLTAGLPYDIRTWERDWPVIMKAALEACKEAGSRFVFFDNIYAYDPSYVPHMTEQTPIKPSSKKGNIRARLINMIMDAVEKDNLQALIARSADFYGPSNSKSLLGFFAMAPLSKGKTATWPGPVEFKHSFTYTPDAGKATALLGNTFDAYNQSWHLPTASPALTGREWIQRIAERCKTKPKYRTAGSFMMSLFGLFNREAKEMVEMLYQYDRDYIFDSSKFEKRFNFVPTPYAYGLEETLKADFGLQ